MAPAAGALAPIHPLKHYIFAGRLSANILHYKPNDISHETAIVLAGEWDSTVLPPFIIGARTRGHRPLDQARCQPPVALLDHHIPRRGPAIRFLQVPVDLIAKPVVESHLWSAERRESFTVKLTARQTVELAAGASLNGSYVDASAMACPLLCRASSQTRLSAVRPHR